MAQIFVIGVVQELSQIFNTVFGSFFAVHVEPAAAFVAGDPDLTVCVGQLEA